MDRLFSFVKQRLPGSQATPKPQPLDLAAQKIGALSSRQTTVEQLAALAYAWGADESCVSPEYRTHFEEYKSDFLKLVDKKCSAQEAAIAFNTLIRATIRAQLPPNLCEKLERTNSSCKGKLESDQNYSYKAMKTEMIGAIKALINDSTPPTGSSTTSSTTTLNSSPTSSIWSSGPPNVEQVIPEISVVPITISPLNAPPKLEFLNYFPTEWRSRPAWANVIASMDAYLSNFDSYRGDAQRTLLAQNPAALKNAVASIQLHTALPAEEAARVAYEREIVNIAMRKPFDETTNEQVLGCKASRMMQSQLAKIPGNQLSIAMRAPLLTADGRTCHPVILSVSAPALDTASQPEWNCYVKDGRLDHQAYRTAFQTLAGQIMERATKPEHKDYEVVLSGFGLANFLAGLSPEDKKIAVGVGTAEFLALITDLRNAGVDVAYTDYTGSAPPWPGVNAALGDKKLQCLGSIPGAWIKNEQIIVNAWDPHALVGNGCKNDQSLDGYIGRNSLVHETHALACALHAHGFGS